MAYYPNALFSTFAFIGFSFCVIPLYWHLEAWNVGTSLYMFWAGLACLNAFINSVAWSHSVVNSAPVWCDISIRIIVAAGVGIPAALLVINRRLYKIATRTVTFLTDAEKRRDLYIDLAIGIGIPILQLPMHAIVEGHRFDIFEDVGCYPNIYNTPLAFIFVYIWPLVINLITAVYAGLNMYVFWKSSQQLNGMLASNKNPNHSRYIRLIALSGTQIFCSLPMIIYTLYFNVDVVPVSPWISWEDTHFNYSFVHQYPAVEWHASSASVQALEVSRWYFVASAFVYFAFFGFAEEAKKHYRKAYTFASSRLRFPEFGSTRASSSSLNTPASSFGPGLKNGMGTFFSFKGGFSALGSRVSERDAMTERRALYSGSDHRLTSDSSIFEGIHDKPQAFGFPPDGDNALPAPARQNVVVTMPPISRVPVPPTPVAYPFSPSIPQSRLDSPLPHRPTSSYLDVPEDV